MCPHLTDCAIFQHFQLESTSRVWQIKYCETGYKKCARYQLSLAGEPVPLTLLPNGQLLRLRPPTLNGTTNGKGTNGGG